MIWTLVVHILNHIMESEGLPFMQISYHGSNFDWYPWIMPRLMQHHRSVRFRIVLDHPWIISHPTTLHHQTVVVRGNIRCKIFHWSKIDMRSKWQGSDKKPWIMGRRHTANLVSTTSQDDVTFLLVKMTDSQVPSISNRSPLMWVYFLMCSDSDRWYHYTNQQFSCIHKSNCTS